DDGVGVLAAEGRMDLRGGVALRERDAALGQPPEAEVPAADLGKPRPEADHDEEHWDPRGPGGPDPPPGALEERLGVLDDAHDRTLHVHHEERRAPLLRDLGPRASPGRSPATS